MKPILLRVRGAQQNFSISSISCLALFTWLVLAWLDVHQARAAEATAWEVVQRGPHERRWEKATQRIGSDGGVEWRTNAFVELASGLHYWREGAWRDSKETIQVAGDQAVALDGQHQLILGARPFCSKPLPMA